MQLDESALEECRRRVVKWTLDLADANLADEVLRVYFETSRAPQQVAGEVERVAEAMKAVPVDEPLLWPFYVEMAKVALSTLAPAKPICEERAIDIMADAYIKYYMSLPTDETRTTKPLMRAAFRALSQHADIRQKQRPQSTEAV